MAENPKKTKISSLAWVLLLSSAFFVLFLVVSGIFYFYRSPGKGGETRGSGSLFSEDAVGIVEVKGAIMDSKRVLKRLDNFADDPRVKAVVLRLNSPGGAVAPSQEIYEAVREYKKPIVASMGSVAASGAFYIACGAKKVYANAGTLTGSIGVIMEFANLEKLYDWAKVHRYSLKTGKFKDAGADYREMTAEERGLLQTMIEDVLKQFKEAVSEGRKLSMEQVTAVADGRIFSGSQAKTAKLVDELGTLDDAVHEAAKMANIQGEPKVVYPEKHRSKWLDLLMENGGDDDLDEESNFDSASLKGVVKSLGQKVTGLPPGIYWIWGGAI